MKGTGRGFSEQFHNYRGADPLIRAGPPGPALRPCLYKFCENASIVTQNGPDLL